MFLEALGIHFLIQDQVWGMEYIALEVVVRRK